MTTIAFKDGVLAADRLIQEAGERYGYVTKIGATKDAAGKTVLYASCGATSLGQRWRAWIESGFAAGEDPPDMGDESVRGHGFIFYDDGRLLTFDPKQPPFWTELLRIGDTAVAAFGSGSGYALGAMAIGASSSGAVLAASRFDTRTGGGIDIVSFRDPVVHRATLLEP